MNQIPSETTYWSWAIRGLGGVIAILDGMVKFGPRLTAQQHSELRELGSNLYTIVGMAEKRIHENGAEYHGTKHPEFIRQSAKPIVASDATDHADHSNGS